MLNHRVIRREDCATSKWAGGETRQIYIFPEDSSYADRTFDLRISSATVDLEESDFTSLPGYNRYIMPLTGGMHLIHEDNHEIKLSPFNVDYFSGSWKTKCYGKCVDFNLMLKEGYKGSLKAVQNLCSYNVELDKQLGIYSLSDNLNVVEIINGQENLIATLFIGDMLLFAKKENSSTLFVLVDEATPPGETVAINIKAYVEV